MARTGGCATHSGPICTNERDSLSDRAEFRTIKGTVTLVGRDPVSGGVRGDRAADGASVVQSPVMARRVGILLFDDVEVLDFAGPFEVFSTASRMV